MSLTQYISETFYGGDDFLYHGTSINNLKNIEKMGFNEPLYLGSEEMADYFGLESIEADGGDDYILFKIPLRDLDQTKLEIDWVMYEEPITMVIGLREDDIQEEFDKIDQPTWKDSIEQLQSVIYRGKLKFKKEYIQ
jgi:hypothetical protein